MTTKNFCLAIIMDGSMITSYQKPQGLSIIILPVELVQYYCAWCYNVSLLNFSVLLEKHGVSEPLNTHVAY